MVAIRKCQRHRIGKHTDGLFKLDTVLLHIALSLSVIPLKLEHASCPATVKKFEPYTH